MLDALLPQPQSTLLENQFTEKLIINPRLNRQLVSFQANKNKPRYRWFKYKEGFSESLIHYILDAEGVSKGHILDPFAGIGTALFVASERGLDATGIELLPVGYEVAQFYHRLQQENTHQILLLLDQWQQTTPWKNTSPKTDFPHLKITKGAFPIETEEAIMCYLTALRQEIPSNQQILQFILLCVLEDVSYTRKDGQYLRWDYRSGRTQGKKIFDKGYIASFDEAILAKFDEIRFDLSQKSLLDDARQGDFNILHGSCLDILPTLESNYFDGLITSPPYLNRYDYTRTYALELALLGVDELEIRRLRQAMLSCTVENRDKDLAKIPFASQIYEKAQDAFENQSVLQAILSDLEAQKRAKMLNNMGIPRMIKNYFLEMAIMIFEWARVLKPNAPCVVVNDNVRYGGIIIPVDLILSDFSQQAGFEVDKIWVLPTGKGNSSQQMGAYGRESLRKCVYIWRRKN